MLSVIVALETLKIMNSEVTIYSDSKYVVEAVEKGWLFDWEKTNFKKKKNIDLWKRFLKIYTKHNIKFIWIKGHANNPLNEVCDKMAVAASFSSNLMIDEEYEKIMEQDK